MNIPIVAERKVERNGVGRIAVLALGTFAVGTDAFILAGFLPDTAAELGVDTAAAGLAVSVFAAAYAVLSPVLAAVTAPLPRRALLIGALVVLAAANLGSAAAPNLAVLLGTRVLAAAGAAAYTPNAGAVAAALAPPELRARALATVVGGLTVATALGVPLGNLVGRVLGWRSALALVAGLCVVAAVWLAAVLTPARQSASNDEAVVALSGAPRVPVRARFAVLRRPGVATVLPLTVLGMAAAYAVYAYSVPALAQVGIGSAATAWVLALYGVGAVLGNTASGYATDRWGATRVLICGYAAMAVALGALGLLAATDRVAPVLVGVLAAVWGASAWCQTPAQQHRLIAAAPAEASLVVALNASCIYLGIGAGTLLGGFAVGHGGVLYAAGAALAVIALLFAAGTTRKA
ncbi:MFS transporter [Nocardia sp. NPDC050713]|uniref:MFS transporter n=1 Tax=Nocardia sp. NPDC050713 TaxID=3154511 RepID=UPI0033E0B514